jgi:hypothetical protein
MIDGPQRVRAVLQLFLLTSTAFKALRTPLATPGTDLALNEPTASQLRFFTHKRFQGDSHALDHPRLYRPAFRLRNHDVHRQPLKQRQSAAHCRC